MPEITPCLWFQTEAEEAARFYVSLIPDSRIDNVVRAPADNPSGPKGAVMVVDFTLAGQKHLALNGGPQFRFTEAVSFIVNCEDQAEIDRLWDRLTEGGSPGQCGWLKDRYGLSWQIVPRIIGELMTHPDPAQPGPVMDAIMQMTKIHIAKLQDAAAPPAV